MRILLIHNYYQQYGGEDVYFKSLYKLLHNKHFVLTYTKHSKNIKTHISKLKAAMALFSNNQASKEIVQILVKNKIQIVHIHNIFPLINPIIYNACYKLGIPIIQTLQTYRFLCSKGTLFLNNKVCEQCILKRFKYPAIINGCYHGLIPTLVFNIALYYYQKSKILDKVSTFHFPSRFIRDYYIKYLKIRINRTVVIPNFILTKKTHKNQTTRRKNKYFIFVGRLAEEKGILFLLKIFKKAKLPLIVIGTGPLSKKVSKYKSSTIKILGFKNREEVFTYMRYAIATIIPSPWYEVCPTVLIESIYNKTPVIVPKYGVFRELVKANKTGFFYENQNSKSLLKLIIEIYSNIDKIKFMKTYLENEYELKYSSQVHYDSIITTYKNLVKKT